MNNTRDEIQLVGS